MKRLLLLVSTCYIALLCFGFAFSPKMELLHASANISTGKGLSASDKDGNKGYLYTMTLNYNLEIKFPYVDLYNDRKNLYEFKIVPSAELVKVIGENPFHEDKIRARGEEIKPEEPDKMYYHINYEIGQKGTGLLDTTNMKFPFPTEQHQQKIKETALQATFIVLKNKKEVGRFDLQKVMQQNK